MKEQARQAAEQVKDFQRVKNSADDAVPQHRGVAPGTERPTRFRPKLRYELIGCGLHGHELVGTDVATVGPEDRLVVRQYDGLRWYRCLRCDSWLPLPLPLPDSALRDRLPHRDELPVPLRGKPLRDRFVLRLIALDRLVHVVVLAAITVAVFLFAQHRAELHHDYVRVLNDLQGGLGGPLFDTRRGIFPEINRLFALSTTELYLLGAGVAAYTVLLAVEAVGLWRARRWAEYLTLVETGVLVPFEVYELTKSVSALKVLTLVINLAIVLYLLISKRLFGIRGGGRVERGERLADTGWPALERAAPQLDEGPSQWGSGPVRAPLEAEPLARSAEGAR